jgi:hypothetical protein
MQNFFVFCAVLHFELTEAVAAAGGAENVFECRFLAGNGEKTDMAADGLCRTVAVHVLCTGVPGSHDSFQVFTDDGIVG